MNSLRRQLQGNTWLCDKIVTAAGSGNRLKETAAYFAMDTLGVVYDAGDGQEHVLTRDGKALSREEAWPAIASGKVQIPAGSSITLPNK